MAMRGGTDRTDPFHEWFSMGDSGWALEFSEYRPEEERSRESLLTLGNGYIGVRGAAGEAEAGDPGHYPGMYLAGGYNRSREQVAGRTFEPARLVNWPNWLVLGFRPRGGDWLSPDRAEVLRYRQQLDCRSGLLRRGMRLRDGEGRETTILSWRLVSMARPYLAGIKWVVIPHGWSGPVEVRSALDGDVANRGVDRFSDLPSEQIEVVEVGSDDRAIWLEAQCRQSLLHLGQASRLKVAVGGRDAPAERWCTRTDRAVEERVALECRAGEALVVEKVVALRCSRDMTILHPLSGARRTLDRTGPAEQLRADHERDWGRLWVRYEPDVLGPGDPGLPVRLGLFHLLATLSPHVVHLDVGAPARGLHGEEYFGHVFWDHVFLDRFFCLHTPDIARSLLRYRYRRLDTARDRARAVGCRGALFPWRSAAEGIEETPTLDLNPRTGEWIEDHTHLQRHVNAAVAYNIWQLYQATDDPTFLEQQGAELFLEICRYWADAARLDPATGRYHWRGVVGPDEFHTAYPGADRPGIDDNAYTNVMAAWCLATAPRVLGAISPRRRGELLEQLGVTPADREAWREIATHIFVPFHDGAIVSQFLGYEQLLELDWDGYRARHGDIRRIDYILEAEGDSVLRYKASKQADVLMLLYLLPFPVLRELLAENGYRFDEAMALENLAYYERRTSHGSSLSNVVHAWVALRWGRAGAWDRFVAAARLELDAVRAGALEKGIHLAAMGGTLDLVQRCLLGAEVGDRELGFDPCPVPPGVEICMPMSYRGARLVARRTGDSLEITADEARTGDTLLVACRGTVRELTPGEKVSFKLR